MQLLLAQSMALLQSSPTLSLQAPAPLQTSVPSHIGASSVPLSGMFVQIPLVASMPHDLHVPVHDVSQQIPSAQKLLKHSMPSAHVAPLHFFAHFVPPQSTSPSSPFFMPSLHEMQFSWKQLGFVPVLQSPSPIHSTHMAMLLHLPP